MCTIWDLQLVYYTLLKGTKTTTKSDNAIQDNNKLAIIGGVAGALLLLLLLVIAVIIIILICKAVKSRNKQSQLINELLRYLHSDLDTIVIIIVFLHAAIMKGTSYQVQIYEAVHSPDLQAVNHFSSPYTEIPRGKKSPICIHQI